MRYFVGCLFSGLLGGLLAIALTQRPTVDEQLAAQERGAVRGPSFPLQSTPPKPPIAEPPAKAALPFPDEELSPAEAIAVSVYEHVNKSVVNITTRSVRVDRFFFMEIPSEGTGSGSVVDTNGHILTNFHVVENAQQVNVTLYDGKSYHAELVGADPINDLAVIRIDAPRESLFPVTLGDSSRLKVGMTVFAIGNPFGLERTMTTGIISSLNRSLQLHANRTIKSIIQIDADINPGNSGGPLIDSRGRLIGITTAIASKTGQSSGVGFAMPVNLAARVIPQLIAHGRVIRAEIGIQRVYETEQGLLIAQLTPDGPAERAGLKGPQVVRQRKGPFVIERLDRSAADMIIAVDGETMKTADDFISYIEAQKPGDRVELTILRGGREMTVAVVLGGGQQVPRPGETKI